MDADNFKYSTEVAKNIFEIIGFFFLGLYFLYRLLAGFFVPCRLAVEITCDTPFEDKKLVRTVVKIKNKGEATVRIEEARLWVFKLPGDDPTCVDAWPLPNASKERTSVRKLETGHLDFQRLSFDHEGLHLYEAGTKRRWINVESAGEQQREFLFNLDDGLYKVEFRLIGTPMFGRRLALTRAITYPVFHLSRASQWVATAVIATGRKAAIKPLRDEGEGPPRNGKI